MKKLFLSLLAITLFCNVSISQVSSAPPDWVDGSGGTIYTLFNLYWLTLTPDAWDEDWKLAISINGWETHNWNGGKGLSPIGDSPYSGTRDQVAFTGTFDGQGNSLEGLLISRTDEWYVGLFGYLEGAHIKNLKLRDITVENDSYYTAALAGYASWATVIEGCEVISGSVTGNGIVGGILAVTEYNDNVISDCHYEGYIYGEGTTGGIIGRNLYGTISNCSVFGEMEVRGNYNGGLVGWNEGDISECYTDVSVTGLSTTTNLGGLVGYNMPCNIRDCFVAGDVWGYTKFGGLIGTSYSSNISNCYFAGALKDTVQSAAFIEENSGSGTITNCYFDTLNAGRSDGIRSDESGSAEVTGLTTADFELEDNFVNWNFDTIWKIEINEKFDTVARPYLQWTPNDMITGNNSVDNSKLSISLYPNPANDVITIECDEPVVYAIFDLGGKMLLSGSTNSTTNKVSVKTLNSGIYFLQLTNGLARTTKKLVVTR